MWKLWSDKKNQKASFLVSLVTILLLAGVLRFFHYPQFPVFGETADETAWTWLGSSLIQEGRPTSWSYFSQYVPDYVFRYDPNGQAPLVRPALDHPPLFSLLPGSIHSLMGAWDQAPSAVAIRLPMVLLGTINTLLFFLVAYTLYNKRLKPTLFASVLFATIPSIVFLSRLVVAENLMVTLLLLTALLISQQSKNKVLKLMQIITFAFSPLTKIAALTIPVAAVLAGVQQKRKTLLKVSLIGLTLGLMTLLIYITIYNFSLFTAVQFGQSTRDIGFTTLFTRFALHPAVVAKLFIDGWLMLGLLSVPAIFLVKSDSVIRTYLRYFLLLYITFILISVGERTVHGWYTIPLWPILVLGITDMARILWHKKHSIALGLAWLASLSTLTYVAPILLNYPRFSPIIHRLFVMIAFVPLLNDVISRSWMQKILLSMVVVLVFANIVTVLGMTSEIYWVTEQYFKELP